MEETRGLWFHCILSKKISKLHHDYGVARDNSRIYGTAIFNKSSRPATCSFNNTEFFAACESGIEYAFFQNSLRETAVIPMLLAKKFFEKGDNKGEFTVIEWSDIVGKPNPKIEAQIRTDWLPL